MDTRLSIFSIVRDDIVWPRIWIEHYIKHVDPSNIFILNCSPESHLNLLQLADMHGFNLIDIASDILHDSWVADTASKFQNFLLNTYDAVLYSEIDEIVALHPSSKHTNLIDFADDNLHVRQTVRCTGYEIVQNLQVEDKIDFRKPLLQQRNYWYHSIKYSKPLLTSRHIKWSEGFYSFDSMPPTEIVDRELLLLQMQKIDFNYAADKYQIDPPDLVAWFQSNPDCGYDPDASKEIILSFIPNEVRNII